MGTSPAFSAAAFTQLRIALRLIPKEIGLPATLRDIGADENTDLKRIADSCILSAGSYKQMTHKEILEIFQECY